MNKIITKHYDNLIQHLKLDLPPVVFILLFLPKKGHVHCLSSVLLFYVLLVDMYAKEEFLSPLIQLIVNHVKTSTRQ